MDDAYYGEEYSGYQGGGPDLAYGDTAYSEAGYGETGYRDMDYPEAGYAEPQYAESQYGESQYAEPEYAGSGYAEPEYAEARFEPARRRNRDAREPDFPEQRDSYEIEQPRNRRERSTASVAPNHLPHIAGLAAALTAASFVRPGAVAAVVLVAQAAVAWAVLDILGVPGRRAAVIAFLPALGADFAAFRFSPYVSATGVVAGIGCGFVLAAADSVVRARRHGVEPGASKELAATVTAQLFACLTGLFVAAARMDGVIAAGGGVLAGLFAYAASRNSELNGSRTAVVGFGCAAAALATYAAAILMA